MRRINDKEKEKEVKWRIIPRYSKSTKGKTRIYEKQ